MMVSPPPIVAAPAPRTLDTIFGPGALHSGHEAALAQNTRRLVVLVIDDEQSIREVIAEVLEDDGYEVITAPDGAAALRLLGRPGAAQPAVILLDMRMPGVNGWDFAKAYRRQPGPHAPIVAVSAAQDAGQYALEIAATAHIGKPFDILELLTLVGRLTRRPA